MDQLERRLFAARRLAAIDAARGDLLQYLKLVSPDPDHPEDPHKTRYEETPLARLLCQIMQKVERRELKRVAVSVGPQMGKSQILSRAGPAWMAGRNPYLNLILGTYNQPFANEFGDAVRELYQSEAHRQIFPEAHLRKAAVDLLVTDKNGRLAFVGRGGSGTGKPADVFLVDDPLKDDIEAQSPTTRDQTWSWFNKVAMTRCHANSAIVIVHTRWHQDDLIGRLCDPDHPERNKRFAGIAERWTYINLPAVVEDRKLAAALGLTLEMPTNRSIISMFGKKPMSSIWPGRKSLEFLAEAKEMDPAGFNALYQGKPTPDDGIYFKADDLVEYDRHEMPTNLRMYGASDHAVSERRAADYSVIGCVGIDDNDTIWVMPDVFWDKVETDETVEELLRQFRTHKPLLWAMEKDNIARSFGPFLRKRMQEESTYCSILGMPTSTDKRMRARSIQGRMQMRKVRFPRFASWWPEARAQMLRFPAGAHDDFVDFIAHIGQMMDSEVAPSRTLKEEGNVVRVGSIEWMLRRTKVQARRERRVNALAGW